MPYYAVESCDVFRCVFADSPLAAAISATTIHCRETQGEVEKVGLGQIYHVVEFGKPESEQSLIPTMEVSKSGPFPPKREH